MKFINALIFSLLFSLNMAAVAQTMVVISSYKEYKKSVKEDNKNELLNIKNVIPNILLDLKYSTSNNFTQIKLYKNAATSYLRRDAATALQKVNSELKELGLGLKIFDAYRPYSITKLMWDLVHDERYVANPAKGSGHNRGIAVDLTLVSLKSFAELNMGTAFDNFTDSAHHSFTKNLPPEVIANRMLLKSTMEKYGFKSLETEWWHYSFSSKEIYDVIDIDFNILAKKIK